MLFHSCWILGQNSSLILQQFSFRNRGHQFGDMLVGWSYMEGTGWRGQAIAWTQIRPLEKLPCLSCTLRVIQWVPCLILLWSLILCLVLIQSKQPGRGAEGQSRFDITVPELRNTREFHKECHSAVLVLQRSLWCKAKGKSHANSVPGRWWGWVKGKDYVIRREGWREFGTSLDFDRKKYLGRSQQRDTAWP